MYFFIDVYMFSLISTFCLSPPSHGQGLDERTADQWIDAHPLGHMVAEAPKLERVKEDD
jgi:hypothetical protein